MKPLRKKVTQMANAILEKVFDYFSVFNFVEDLRLNAKGFEQGLSLLMVRKWKTMDDYEIVLKSLEKKVGSLFKRQTCAIHVNRSDRP